MPTLKFRGKTTYSSSSCVTCALSSVQSWDRYPLAVIVRSFAISSWPRLATPPLLATSGQYRFSSPLLRSLVGTFATWMQASCLIHSFRFHAVLNVMKALRWYRKLLGLSPFPDLYSAAFASLVQPASGEKRESLPLPLSFHAFLERKVLDSDTSTAEAIWAGSFLACMGGSLRFSDAQHVLWSSLCISHFTLRGICYRTKTTKRGAPFAFLGFGVHSTSRDFGMNWLSAWILLLDKVWQELRSSFGAQVTPDCFFFTVGQQGFSPPDTTAMTPFNKCTKHNVDVTGSSFLVVLVFA